MDNWISVNCDLPKGDYDSDLVDVYSKSKGRIIDCYYINKNYWMKGNGNEIDDVTHWMPLPLPPKTGE
ncbi:MAG: hypothetical protein ACJASL_000132 [Paraglaciecola sp.]|jgi:hypothetical protein